MQSRSKNKRLISFLEIHSITKKQRSKAINWMMEIHRIFSQSDETLFRSIFIMDLYLKKNKKTIDSSELQLICIVSIFISSKLSESHQIRMKNVLDNIGKGKYSKKQIIDKEKEIFSLVFACINQPTMNTLFGNILEVLGLPEFVKLNLQANSILLQKMFLYSYDILNVFTFEQLAVYSLVISLKLYEFGHKGFIAQKFTGKILKLVDDDKDNIIGNLNLLRDFASSFKIKFPYSNLPTN